MCKNVQKRASQVLIYQKNVQKRAKMCKFVQKRAKTCKNLQKTCISSTYLPKNLHLKVSFTKKRAKTCKKRAKRAKTCISNIFGPYSKTAIVKVRASWGRVSRGLTVIFFYSNQFEVCMIPLFDQVTWHNCSKDMFSAHMGCCGTKVRSWAKKICLDVQG